MSKRVIVRLDGKGVYGTLEEAGEALGVQPSNVSRAITETGKVRGVPLKWVDRVFAVRTRDDRWTVAVMNNRNSAYLPVSQVEPKVMARDVVEVKDLTAVWYL